MEKGKQLAILEKLGLDPTLLAMLTEDTSHLKAEFDALFGAAGIDANKASEASGEFVDQMFKLKFTIATIKDAIGLQLLGTIRKSVDGMRQMLMRNIPLIIQTITPFIKGILEVSRAFLQIVGRIASWAGTIIGWIVKLNKATGGWVTGIIAVGVAWKVLNSAFLASPLGRLVALGLAIALLVDDFLTWRERGDSLIDWGSGFGVVLQALVGIIGTVLASMALYKGYIIATTIATKAWAGATAIVNGVLSAARTAMLLLNLVMYANPIGLVIGAIALLIGAGVALVKNWDTVKKWFSDFFGWFADKFSKLGSIAKTFAGVFGGGNSVSLTPSPSQAATLGGANQNINQKTEIIVNGAENPQATASLVAGQQGRVNADLARNTKGAAR
jgi:phage-related minor tail protein